MVLQMIHLAGAAFGKSGRRLLFGIFLAAFGMNAAENSFVRNNPDGSQTLTGHVPSEVRNSTATFVSRASMNIDARIILPLQNRSELDGLLQDLYDPQSPTFHHFLTSGEFSRRFTPSATDSAQVQEFLRNEGALVTGQSPNGAVLDVEGPEWAFEHAFGLHINNYRRSDGTTFFAPDADPTIPATLAGKILAVGGLDNFPRYRSHLRRYPNAAAEAAGSGPIGGLTPAEVKTAYNLDSIPSTGAGQTIALFEVYDYSPSDIAAFEAEFGLPSVPLQNIFVDEASGTPPDYCCSDADETPLDIEMVTAFAPGSNILVYEANPSSNTSWIDTWTRIATDDIAKVVSCSWGGPEISQGPRDLSFDHMIFSQMAAQGQAVFVAAGDSGAYDVGGVGSTLLAVDEPGSEPHVTDVGISKLATNSSFTYESETASPGGGGGVSAIWSIPSYQTTAASQAAPAAMVSTTMRNVPDVVMNADFNASYAYYVKGTWTRGSGSSISAPIWASFVALVNQGLGSSGPLGFANPALYRIAQSSSYANDFHDITTGNNLYYPAEPGFDDATGLGSFNGLNLYNDLVNNAALAAPSPPSGLSALVGNAQVSLSWSASSGSPDFEVKRSTVSGGPYTVIASPVLYTTYTDTGVTNGTTYYYVVSAVNSGRQSSNSAQVSATPVVPSLAAPAGLTATAGNAQVSLSWSASPGATSYLVRRTAVSGAPYAVLAASITSTAYVDNSVTNGFTYYYVVSAVNSAGQVADSSQVSARPLPPPPSEAPSGLRATAGNAEVILSWAMETTDTGLASSYVIGRSTTSGGPYTQIASVTIPTYTDSSVTNRTTYYYVVSAVDFYGQSGPKSAQVRATPSAPRPPLGRR